MARWVPTFRPQIGDPTTKYDPVLCTWSSGAMLLDRHTQGRISVWGGELLAKANLKPADIANGGNLIELSRGWLGYGEGLDIRQGNWDQFLIDIRDRGAVLQGDYDRFSPSVSCQPGFTGNHAIYVSHQVSATKMYAGDPLCTGFKEYPLDQVREYAEKLSMTQIGTKERLFYAVSQQDPGDVQMIHVKPAGSFIGTFRIVGSKHSLIDVSNTQKRYPVNDGTVLNVIASLNLVDATGAPIDIEGSKPPANNRNQVYLVDLPTFGSSAFALRVDGTFTAAPTMLPETISVGTTVYRKT